MPTHQEQVIETLRNISSHREFTRKWGDYIAAGMDDGPLAKNNQDQCQRIIDFEAKHDDCWLGKTNFEWSDHYLPAAVDAVPAKRVLTQFKDQRIYAFGACFMVPVDDPDLEWALIDRNRPNVYHDCEHCYKDGGRCSSGAWYCPKRNQDTLAAILKRVDELRGEWLHWS